MEACCKSGEHRTKSISWSVKRGEEPKMMLSNNDGENETTEINEKVKEAEEFIVETKLYKRRWLQLGLFFVYAACNSMQWIQLTIISNITSRYYGVSRLAIEWTALLFHVMYVIMLLPASYLMSYAGLRWTCLIGAIGTSIGSWIKFCSLSVPQYQFVSVFVGQAIVATCQIFVLAGPARLAAYWFGPNEVATATAIGFAGGMVGISSFFLIVPLVVKDHERLEDIEQELSSLFFAVAVVCTAVTVALFCFFQEEPRLSPSKASAFQRTNRRFGNEALLSILKRIITNGAFLMLWNSYGINAGFLNAVSTLLNPMYLAHFKNGEADAGMLGLLMNLPGNVGSIIFCMILDKMKNFKTLGIFIYVFSLVGQVLFAIGLIMEIKWLIFAAVLVIGVFTISCGTVSFELSAEATYPEPEELSSGLLNVAQQIYGTTLVLITSTLLRTYGDKSAHIFLVVILIFGLMLTIFSKINLKRYNAETNVHYRAANILLEVTESSQISKNKKLNS